MAIITQGTLIKKVTSGGSGTPIKKVLSGGTVIWTSTVMRTITIPEITGVGNQKLQVDGETIYNGTGGIGVTVQVEHGKSVTIIALAYININDGVVYDAPTVISPVTANADFSTASYITAGRRMWTANEYFIPVTVGTSVDKTMTGLLAGTPSKPIQVNWTISADNAYKEGSGSITSSSAGIIANTGGSAPDRVMASITASNDKLTLTLDMVGANVTQITIVVEVYQ